MLSQPDRGQVYTSDSSNVVIAERIYEALMFYDDVARVTASPAPKERSSDGHAHLIATLFMTT